MQPDFERTAAAMVAGAQKAIAAAVAPLLARAEAAEKRAAELEQRLAAVEAREAPSVEGLCDKAAVDGAIAPLIERVAALESRNPEPGQQGEPGRDGKDIDPAEVERMIDARVKAAVAGLPPAEKGADGIGLAGGFINRDGVLILTTSSGEAKELGAVVGRDGRDGIDGKDGAHAAVEEVVEAARPLLAEEVQKAVAAIPLPKDGASVTVEDVAPMILAEVEKAVSALPPPEKGEKGDPGRDGHDVEDIAVTLDGRTLEFGFTVGEVKSIFELELPEGPAGLPGDPGIPGEKGDPGETFGFDDFDAELADDMRTLRLGFGKGDQRVVKEFVLPTPQYAGTYRDGPTYAKGDMATYGGSLWIAVTETSAKPETSADWKICAKRGRDGKPGKAAPDA